MHKTHQLLIVLISITYVYSITSPQYDCINMEHSEFTCSILGGLCTPEITLHPEPYLKISVTTLARVTDLFNITVVSNFSYKPIMEHPTMKYNKSGRFLKITIGSLLTITSSLVFSTSVYANNLNLAMNDSNTVAMNTARPYHHAASKFKTSNHQSSVVMTKTKAVHGGKPYRPFKTSHAIERAEFAAFETSATSKKVFKRKISEGGKPRYLP